MKITKSNIKFMDILNSLTSSFKRIIFLAIILGLVFTSSTQTELKLISSNYDSQSNLGPADHYVKQLKDPASNPSEWLICGINSWDDLKTYLPEAKMAGISVWAILIPPYQSPPVNPDCPYSEPFRTIISVGLKR